MLCQFFQQDINRSFRQSALTCKCHRSAQCRCYRQQKTQCGTTFAAVQHYFFIQISFNRNHFDTGRFFVDFCTQSLQTTRCRFQIIRPAIYEQHAFFFRQCRCNQRAVTIRFRRNDTHLTFIQWIFSNFYIHIFTSYFNAFLTSSVTSSTGIFTISQWPTFVGNTKLISPPLLFLSFRTPSVISSAV